MKKENITFAEYEEKTESTDISKDKNETHFAFIGLMGEIGDLLSIFKKELRGDIESKNSICTELGDILWYFSKICRKYDIKFHDLVDCEIENSVDNITENFERENKLVLIGVSKFSIEISKRIGVLANAIQDDDKDEIRKALYDVLILLVSVSYKFQLSISKIMNDNIEKTKKRFSAEEFEVNPP